MFCSQDYWHILTLFIALFLKFIMINNLDYEYEKYPAMKSWHYNNL